MKTILITGGAGFIGSNFVRLIYERYPDYKILVLDVLTYAGSVESLPKGSFDSKRFEFWYANIRNADAVDNLMSRADIVVHFAAETHVTRSIYDNFTFFDTDVIGTQVVTNSALKHRNRIQRFIHISTSEVYGTALSEKMNEDHPLNPMSPYASAKCGADRLVYSYWATYDLPVVIVRPFNNYGPNQHLEKLIPRFITSCILGEPLSVHGDGSAGRDWLYVQDHCEALDKILHCDLDLVRGQVLNIGTGKTLSILEIAQQVKKLMNDDRTPIERVGNRPGQVFRHTCDPTRIQKVLGWKPAHSFEDGLKKTIEWYVQNRSWWQSQVWMRHIPIVTLEGRRELH